MVALNLAGRYFRRLTKCCHFPLTSDMGVHPDTFVFLLHVDRRKLTLWHHGWLIQEQQSLVRVHVIVVLGRRRRRPDLSQIKGQGLLNLANEDDVLSLLFIDYTAFQVFRHAK